MIGLQKRVELHFLRAYIFKMVKPLTLLGYNYNDGEVVLELIALGSHEFCAEIENIDNNLLQRLLICV